MPKGYRAALWPGETGLVAGSAILRSQGVSRRDVAILIAVLTIIPFWQSWFLSHWQEVDRTYVTTASRGLYDQYVSKFIYFYRHLGLFPVAIQLRGDTNGLIPAVTLAEAGEDSREGALDELARHGRQLVMDAAWTFRAGDPGRIFLYYADVILRGTTHDLRVRPFNALYFIGGLCALFAAFWWIGQPLLGCVLVLLLGSNPCQIAEVYARENLLGLSISTAIWILAIHIPLLTPEQPRYYAVLVAAATGVAVGTIRQIRTEPTLMILSPLMSYCFLTASGWRFRASLVGILGLSLMVTLFSWDLYFAAKVKRAAEVVAALGGHPFPVQRRSHHPIWHPIWCGLGDFDRKYGYAFDDRAAYAYALPRLHNQYGFEIPAGSESRYFLKTYWDEDKVYPKLVDELPHYDEILRDKILHDVLTDPYWYVQILARRVGRIISLTTPVRLDTGPWHLDLPLSPILFVPLLGMILWRRNWFLVKLCLFFLPLSLTALLVFSGQGTTYYSCYHLSTSAIMITLVAQSIPARLCASRYRKAGTSSH